MSVVNVEHTCSWECQQDHNIELPTSIQEKLHTVIRQNWRAELVHRVAVVVAVGLLAVIVLIVMDVLLGLRSASIRWTIWVAGLGIALGAIRYFVVKPWQRNDRLLDAAWKIESSHPAMEERLTSTIQFLEEGASQHTSQQLIAALVAETSEGVCGIDAEAVPTLSSQIPVTVAAVLVTTLVFSAAIWPKTVLMSLDNLLTPWSPYRVPGLLADVSPGNVTVAEGGSVNVEVIATEALDHPTLEVIRGDVVESHVMVTTSPEASTFTLVDVSQDAVYRIHSGGLYSVPHSITVHPQPQLSAIAGHLTFPEYTHLDPLTIERVAEPIEVPAGSEVTLTALSDDVAVDGVIRWSAGPHEVIAKKVTNKGSKDAPHFEWKFKIDAETFLVGTLEVRSEYGVRSVPHPIEIRGLDDMSPSIEITTPSLRQLTLRRDGDLPIRYRVRDDFGVSETELMVKFGEQEPVALSCPDPQEQSGGQRVWTGTTSLELSDVPADSHAVSLWLRTADNRPEEFGGPQVVESEEIRITLDENADSLGQQQILADRQRVEPSLEKAIEQMQAALAAAEALQNDRGESGVPNQGNQQDQLLAADDSGLKADHPVARPDHIDALRQQTLKAKQTLDQLAGILKDPSNLFRPKAAKIQQIADREVTEALELANQIPLTDDPAQQDELARNSQDPLASAIEQIDQLRSDIEQQAEQMERAAQLDQLASKQERLAQKAAEVEQNGAPNEQWLDRQAKVAHDLQNLVEENQEARRQQLLQRAKEAAQMAQQAEQLARQQRKLGALMDDVAKAAEEGELDQPDALEQDTLAQQAQQLQQKAEQLSQQNIPDQPAREQIEQAADQLRQAKEKVDKARKALGNQANIEQQDRAELDDGEIKRDQQAAGQKLEQAAKSLNEACKSCRRAAKQSASNGRQDVAKQDGNLGPRDENQPRQGQLDDDKADQDDPKAEDQPQLDPHEREKLLEQADQADQLAKQAQQVAGQQQQLEQAMREAQQKIGKPEAAQRQLQDLIEAQKDEINQQAKQSGQRQVGPWDRADKEAKEKQQQRMDEAAKAAQEGDMDAAAAKIQEQIADRAEEIQQQAEQLAKQVNPEAAVQERAKQAAEHLQQAQQKADQAKQSLCEKCNGGGRNKSGGQSKPETQDKLSAQNKPGAQDQPGAQNQPGAQPPQPNGRNQGAKPQHQKPQPQQRGAAQPKGGQPKQAPEQDDAKTNRDQKDAIRSLQQASLSLNQVCKSCRESANGNKPGPSSGSKSGNSESGVSPKNKSPSGAKQLAKASDGAKQAAKSPSNEKAAREAESVAEQLNQLADVAAQNSGYSLRQQKGSPAEKGKQQGTGNKPGNKPDNQARSGQPGQPSTDPQGVGNAAGDTNVKAQKLRGGSSSNWTRSRRKLDGGVLDDQEGNVPEQYRGVVKRYFEELSRQQSSREE